MNLLNILGDGLVHFSAMPTWAILLSKATLLMAAAWLAHFALTKANPRWRILLWRGAVVGVMLICIWTIGLPGVAIRLPAPEIVARTSAPSTQLLDAGRDEAFFHNTAVNPTEIHSTVEMPITTQPETMLPAESLISKISWQIVFLGIWVFGALLLSVRLAIGYLRLARLLHDSQPAPERIADECRRIADALGCRRAVQIRSSRKFMVPFLYGMVRPVIVLPERMCEASFHQQLLAILAHELAHTRSSDLVWNAVMQFISIALWFHPLAWRMGSAHRAACDAVCDAVSASYLGDVQAYCRTLARVALEATTPIATVGLAMARSSDVRRRLAALKQKVFTLSLKRRTVDCVAMVGLAAIMLLAGLRFAMTQAPEKENKVQVGDSAEVNNPESDSKDLGDQKTAQEKSSELESHFISIHVRDQDGKPLPGAEVSIQGQTRKSDPNNSLVNTKITIEGADEQVKESLLASLTGTTVDFGPKQYRTDADGNVVLEVPKKNLFWYQFHIQKKDFVTTKAQWQDTSQDKNIPASYTFKLEHGVTIGGIVRDKQGKPIADAEVYLRVSNLQKFIEESFVDIRAEVKTDSEGKWRCEQIPRNLKDFPAIAISVRHPDYGNLRLHNMGFLASFSFPTKELLANSAVFTMPERIPVVGVVTDPQGKPVAGAGLGLIADSDKIDFPLIKTDENGQYLLSFPDFGDHVLVAYSDGYAPVFKKITLSSRQETANLQLGNMELVRFRIVDLDGKPVRGAKLAIDCSSGDLLSLIRITQDLTDEEGCLSQLWPPDSFIEVSFTKQGYSKAGVGFGVAQNGEEQTLTMVAGGWTASGRVIDRDTKKPIAKFYVVDGIDDDEAITWKRTQLTENKDGQYAANWNTQYYMRRAMRIEADDYYPSEIRRLEEKDTQVTCDFELVKGRRIAGIVRSPDGKPLTDATVALCTETQEVRLSEGYLESSEYTQPMSVRTGPDGMFSFRPQQGPYLLFVIHDQGFAKVGDKENLKEIIIKPWAKVEGKLMVGDRPGKDEAIKLEFDIFQQINKRSWRDYSTQTDAEGHFVFKHVHPGKATISREIILPPGSKTGRVISVDKKSIEVVSGETLKVDLISASSD